MTAINTRRRGAWWAAVLVAGVAASVTAVAAPAGAAEQEVADGYLDWGFKQSFRQYVSTGNGNPPMSASDGATINPDGTFRFPVTSGSYDDQSGAGTVAYGGTVVFSYPAHFFEIVLANPTMVLDGGSGVLLADIELTVSGGDFEPVDVEQAEIALLDPAGTSPIGDGDTLTWSNVATTLTATGAQAFAGFYSEGTELDPLSTVVSTGEPLPGGPTVTVTPATGLDPDGATVQVSGSGFDPTSPGIYVAFGPTVGDWWLDPGQFQLAKWVHPGGTPSGNQDRLNPDGTFSTTLDVSASYTNDHGEPVDCLTDQCYVLTMRAHGLPDRSQDTTVPVSFNGGGPPPGNGTAQQELTVDVLGGPLTLAVTGQTVTLSDATIGGTATGDLHSALVEDLRGTDAGWSLVGQSSEFAGEAGAFGGDQLGWTPTASATGGTGAVTPGDQRDSGLGEARTLCASAAGASGGSFECGAQLQLSIPESTQPGRYTATLTLTLA